MAKLTPGQIFLADNREVITTDAVQYFKYLTGDGQQPAGLSVCNDGFLAARKDVCIDAPANGFMIIIPVTGALDVITGGELPLRVDVGEVHIRYMQEGEHCTLSNQYADDWINFLHLHLDDNSLLAHRETVAFDFEKLPDQLISVGNSALPFKIHIGMFGGRKEALYQLANAANKLFAIIIAGAFEMQGRLLHQRDALMLWDLPEADIEALSNNAVMVMMEF